MTISGPQTALLAAACLAIALSSGDANAQAAPNAGDPLVGLWVSDNAWDPGPSGALTLTKDKDGWHAAMGDAHADFRSTDSVLAFEFPNHRGSFRGAFAKDGRTISGFWIQPHSTDNDPRDPDGEGQTFASPLTLAQTSAGTWSGNVVPLRDTFTLYLKIFAGENGALTAAFRSPEVNSRGGASQFQVAHEGARVSFSAGSNHLSAAFDATHDQLSMRWPDLGRTLTLARATPALARGFYPRPSDQPHYVYREPDDAGDGWHVARAHDEGIDEDKLTRLVQGIIDTDPAAARPNLIHSLLIARHGKLVLDEYFAGYDRDRQHDLRSAGKTFASVLIGALMHEHVAISPDTRLYPLVAGMGPFAYPDPRKGTITLAQLMTHTSGLACDDNDDSSPGNENTLQSQRRQFDWWKYTLDLPVANDPGKRYAYCSAGTNLMGAALTTAAKTHLPELFDRDIARPLQWGPYYWNMMPNGEGYLGGGVFVRPRDLLKVGQVFLDGGLWGGRRIVDAGWVTESTAPHTAITPATTGLSPENFRNFYFPGEDGYAWHLAVLHTPTHDYPAYGAGGNGGQLLIVVPALDLAVVFTGGNYGQGLIWNKWRDEIIPDAIIPAISG